MVGDAADRDRPAGALVGALALDLAASVRRIGPVTEERLASAADLAGWLRARGLAGPRTQPSAADHALALRLREAVRSALAAAAAGVPADPQDVGVINRAARRLPLRAQLDPARPLWRWAGRRAVVAALSVVAEDAVRLLGGPLRERLRICAADRCGTPFLDRSRPGRRRWCSVTPCADRAKKAARRARAAGAGERRRTGPGPADGGAKGTPGHAPG